MSDKSAELDTTLLRRVLSLYRKRLGEVTSGDADPIVISDVRLIMGRLAEAEESAKTDHVYRFYLEKHGKTVCEAIEAYISYMEKTRDEFQAKLGTRTEMKNIVNEIEAAKRFKLDYCS